MLYGRVRELNTRPQKVTYFTSFLKEKRHETALVHFLVKVQSRFQDWCCSKETRTQGMSWYKKKNRETNYMWLDTV